MPSATALQIKLHVFNRQGGCATHGVRPENLFTVQIDVTLLQQGIYSEIAAPIQRQPGQKQMACSITAKIQARGFNNKRAESQRPGEQR